MTLVSISEAARLAGISRQTFYRHIDKKGISVTKDNDDNPVVDTAEILRVYGALQDTTPSHETDIQQLGTPKDNSALQGEIDKLREAIDSLNTERDRERAQLTEQIVDLRRRLDDEAEERRKLTKLLTDQRTEPERPIPAPQKPTESFRTRLGRWIAGRP